MAPGTEAMKNSFTGRVWANSFLDSILNLSFLLFLFLMAGKAPAAAATGRPVPARIQALFYGISRHIVNGGGYFRPDIQIIPWPYAQKAQIPRFDGFSYKKALLSIVFYRRMG